MAKAAGSSPQKGGEKVTSGEAGDVFSVARIRDLIGLMEECGLSEVDLKQADQQIRLVRGGFSGPPTAVPSLVSAAAQQATPPTVATPAADSAYIKVIKSPMVGSFYSRANPKSEDFVKVGSKIAPDTVVCIVEAMKVFNEIPAEMSGTIVEILAGNEEAVDFDRPLFKVDTRG